MSLIQKQFEETDKEFNYNFKELLVLGFLIKGQRQYRKVEHEVIDFIHQRETALLEKIKSVVDKKEKELFITDKEDKAYMHSIIQFNKVAGRNSLREEILNKLNE